ncbi:hypothetical protein RB195_013878 [Necator americanus]|uniref:Uncharacterized protein n=1 Tax=Necator americanus TaxID=51031 RepID=A0ABR1DYR0_NECAM
MAEIWKSACWASLRSARQFSVMRRMFVARDSMLPSGIRPFRVWALAWCWTTATDKYLFIYRLRRLLSANNGHNTTVTIWSYATDERPMPKNLMIKQ